MDILLELIRSWSLKNKGTHVLNDLKRWYDHLNESLHVKISPAEYNEDSEWEYNVESDMIERKDGAFFSIVGYKNEDGSVEQPIILQGEIGYLGFIAQMHEGVLHFLMQAKIEPGNVNKVQLSPTIQATHSNFMQKHKGAKPNYLEYFVNAKKHEILFDQIQSEQSSRFLGKRNRNIAILVDEKTNIEMLENYRWMTLGQIKEIMTFDNVVNMDTRTVLSCLPFTSLQQNENVDYLSHFDDKVLGNSVLNSPYRSHVLAKVYHYMNDYKMFNRNTCTVCGLSELKNWHWQGSTFCAKKEREFQVVYCDVEIENREVVSWQQPLIQAKGSAFFALAYRVSNNIMEFLVQCRPEPGCFDMIEIGPTWQLESNDYQNLSETEFGKMLLTKMEKGLGIRNKVVMSEEGGRFYHEQNINVIYEVTMEESLSAPDEEEGFFWMNYRELNQSMIYNNVLNIQLRNLLALLTNDGRTEK